MGRLWPLYSPYLLAHKFGEICQELAKIYPFVYFQNGDSRYLEFPKSAILDPYIADIYQHTKFGAYWSRIGQYMPFCPVGLSK